MRGLHLAAMVVTSAHLLLEVVIGVVPISRPVNPWMEIFVLAIALAGLVVARPAPVHGSMSRRWVALGLVSVAVVLRTVAQLVQSRPGNLLAELPSLLSLLAATLAVVVAAGLLGMPRARTRYTAAGVLFALAAVLLVIVSLGRPVLMTWLIIAAPWLLGVAAGVLALKAARRTAARSSAA
jgi:hypothetical protein